MDDGADIGRRRFVHPVQGSNQLSEAFLAAPEAVRITGQVVFVDGGADTLLRGDDVW